MVILIKTPFCRRKATQNNGEIPVSLATKMGWLPFLGNFAREGDAFKVFAYKTFTLISCSFVKSDRCNGLLYHISRNLSTFFDAEGVLGDVGWGGEGDFQRKKQGWIFKSAGGFEDFCSRRP